MLGKTNITTLSESGVVTEVEDFKWIRMQSGVYGNFVKAVYKNNFLVAITAGGDVAYTADGEVWNTVTLEYENCKLNDIDWDGNRFILVGSCSGGSTGLIVGTADFKTFDNMEIFSYDEYYAIMPQNGRYILVARSYKDVVYALFTDFKTIKADKLTFPTAGWPVRHCMVAKNTNEMLVYVHINYSSTNGSSNYHYVYKISDGSETEVVNSETLPDVKAMSPFECKGLLYFINLRQEENYSLKKVTGSEALTMCTGQNFAFTDGVYFNGCELFISANKMLVVKKGESIADKTVGDLIEIAPEFTMNCITNAFGQLYIFGDNGIILKSSAETDNEEVIAVQTLSAKKALAEAKAYTDGRYEALEARIAALEMQVAADS